MIHNDYVKAVNKLEFSNNLLERVKAAEAGTPRFRPVRIALLAAVLACFMITTAFGAISTMRERPGQVEVLGTDTDTLAEAQHMLFSVSQLREGAEKHYMELQPVHTYHFRHGMLRSRQGEYLRISQDYTLEPVELTQFRLTLDKNGRTYSLDFACLDTESGVLSNHRSVYHKNEQGEILLNLTDGNSGQWPAYFNPETGALRDALPEWTSDDFEGRIGYGYELMDGILIATVVNDGMSNSQNILYWIAPGAEEPRFIELPGNGLYHVENNTVYYQNELGQLYCMDADFTFRLICQYETMDYLQDGLLTVSVQGKLGILDAYTGEVYVFGNLELSKTDTLDYHAIRYGSAGTIALVHTEWVHDPERIVLRGLGVLDKQSAQLKLLQIENDYDGAQCNWLDETRLAVIYKSELGQILCVYEFDS